MGQKRLSVTLGDENYALLHRLSELGGQSMGSLVVELVDAARPILTQMVEAAERYRDLDEEKRAAVLAAFEAEHDRIVPRAEELAAAALQINRDSIDAFKRVADGE